MISSATGFSGTTDAKMNGAWRFRYETEPNYLFSIRLKVSVRAVPVRNTLYGEFDLKKAITLKGVVTRVEWVNPHISFNIG